MNWCIQTRPLLLVLVVIFTRIAAAEQVVFSEIMYQPPVGKPEFVEVWNIANTPLDTAKWRLSDGVEFTFPDFNPASLQAHILKPQERIILSAASDAATRAAYPAIPATVRIFGPWDPLTTLDNGGETVTLQDKNGVIVCTVSYGDEGRWPVAADGTGHSLVLADENRAIDDWRVWRASTNKGGSPGLADPALPATGLALNEFHFRAADGHVDWIEIRNNSRTAAQSAAALFVVSSQNPANPIALSGNVPPGEVASFNVDFLPDNDGDVRIYLIDATGNVRSAVKVRRKAGRDAWQMFPAGSGEWFNDTADTRDAQNNPARSTNIVINEIMADPPSNQRDGEFIELTNRGVATVDIGGWRLDEALNYTFPLNTLIAPGGYLVIAANKNHLNSTYPGLGAVGDWSGSLSNGGELVRLLDQNGNLANAVDYRFGGEWPELANGNGTSLELVNPANDNRFGGAWRDSDESQKSTFQAFTINGGTYLKGAGNGSPGIDDEIRIWGVSDTHVILRNLVLRPTAGGANILVNPNVTTLTNGNVLGWQSRGTHAASFHDAEGVHLVTASHGDNKCNHIEKDTAGMLASTQYTLTFEARWIFGKPRLVAQSWDSSWGGTVRVPIPSNLGTPGAQNSRFAVNPAPQVTSLLHSPPIPTSAQTVTVTARVSAATPPSAVQVIHRKDNTAANAAWNTTAMNDGGTGGDAIAGDGIWTAQIAPAAFAYNNAGNYIAEFYVRATATNGSLAELPRNGAVQPGLWATDSQVVPTDLRRMRIVISQYWIDSLNQNSGTGGHTVKFNFKYPRLSNLYVPCTFISNESDIYYGSTVRKTGSPWTRQTDADLTRGRVVLPSDRPFRGKTKLYWDNDAGATMLHNRTTRYWLYLLGVPGNQNEVCRVTRNNVVYAVRETSEAFDKEMLDRIWPNGSDGQFVELDDKFWISDDGSSKPANEDGTWGYKGLDAQGYDNPTLYHSQFIPKSRESEYDYSGLFEWFKQLQNASITQEQCERMADTQAMTALAAVRGYIGDWDNMTIRRGKNGYMHQRAADHKWMMLHWDSDLAFQDTNEAVLGGFPGVGTYFGRPFIRHYMNYYLTEMLNSFPASGPRLQAWLTAEENVSTAYTANGSFYSGWSTGRVTAIQSFLGASRTTLFAVTTPADGSTTAAGILAVVGTAPSTAYSVACVDHPEAVLTWGGSGGTNPAGWTLAGIRLKTGPNTLVFRMYNISGVQVGVDLPRTITKTGDAAPAMVITADPGSYNVGLGEVMTLDATGSTDPDGSALSFAWVVTPNTGVTVTYPLPGKAVAQFTTPGIYTFSVQGTNATSVSTTLVREVAVFSARDFDSFGNTLLPAKFAVSGTELLDNYSPNSWYSLTTNQGSLNLQITDVVSLPLSNTAATFPLLTRPLPTTADFALQTDFGFETRNNGSFFTGLFVETMESGASVKYAFGVDGNGTLALRKATGAGTYVAVGAAPFQPFPGTGSSGTGATLRIRRIGNQLQFHRRVNAVWLPLTSGAQSAAVIVTLPAAGTAVRGGIFGTTSARQGVRMAFDYLGVVDPGQSNDLIGSLRITEVMYNPGVSGGVEFVELRNIGLNPVDPTGVYFEDGNPFSSRFTFGNLILQPGHYCVVTNNTAGFIAFHGTGANIAGQYTGSLNNDGEAITLKDIAGNIIHDFSYSDISPWPATPDGFGPSLEVIATDPALYSLGTNWRASREIGGSPGYLGFAADADGDGQPDTVELAFGSNPNDASSIPNVPATTRTAGGGEVTLAWAGVSGRAYTVEYCEDLLTDTWQSLATVIASGQTVTYTDTSAGLATHRFYRIATRFP